MTLIDILALVPEERRAEAKAVLDGLDGAVRIASREDAERLVRDNPHVKAAMDAGISRVVAEHDAKFVAEKVPVLVDEAIKARMPKPKDPELAAALERVEQLERINKDTAASAVRAQQKARALAKLSEKGFPDKLADLYIGATDEETDAKLGMVFEHLIPWRDKAVQDARVALVGNQGAPPLGSPPAATDTKARLAKAMADGNADLALILQSRLQQEAG